MYPWASGEPARSAGNAAGNGDVLTDKVLLQICRVPKSDPQVTPEWLSKLGLVPRLVGQPLLQQNLQLESALTLLASVLGRLKQFNPTHLPFGYNGPQIQSRGWIEREALERIGKQIVGLIWHVRHPAAVAQAVETAVSEAIRVGFMEQQRYDAWRPGMCSGSGWRSAVTATPYGITRARGFVESTHGQRPAVLANGDTDHIGAAEATNTGSEITACGEVQAGSVKVQESVAKAPPARGNRSAPASDDRYDWARQAELVRALNQVLGEGSLHKAVLSRACTAGHIETNGKPGKGSRVKVPSFLAWVSRQFSIDKDEQNQVRNAVIGEITARNS